mgnify:CR=1 FL=1
MEQLPDFWRTEVFHPLIVHFPIALLLVAFLFKIIALKYKREVWERGGTVLLGLGVLSVWAAIFTGGLAEDIVSKNLCDPAVLEEHQGLPFQLGDDLFDRATGHELDQGKVDDHDSQKGRNHQQKPS